MYHMESTDEQALEIWMQAISHYWKVNCIIREGVTFVSEIVSATLISYSFPVSYFKNSSLNNIHNIISL